jgi:hypothetical protein
MKHFRESDYMYGVEVKLKRRENARRYIAQHVLEMFIYIIADGDRHLLSCH